MADIRSAQIIAQVEWQDPALIKASQVIVQVEYVPLPFGEYKGNISFNLTPEAEESGHYAYDGDVTLSLVPESVYGSGNFFYGDITLSLIPEADILLALMYTGDITVTLIPEVAVIGDYGYEGVITFELIPESVYAEPRPGFDWWFGYGLVDLTFLGNNPPYYCADSYIEGTFTFDSTVFPYRRHTVVASGGVKIGGTGEVSFEVPKVLSVIATGGFAIAGNGIETFILPPCYTTTAEGGVKLSGEGELTFVELPELAVFTLVGSGGYELRGNGNLTFVDLPSTFSLIGFGGYRLSGVGICSFPEIDVELLPYEVTGSGGYKLSGTGATVYDTPDKVFSLVATGVIDLNGAGRIAWLEPEYYHVEGSGGLVLSGEGTEEEFLYYTWVFSGVDYKPSVYSNYDFNSYCTFGGKFYGANEDGIFELAGVTDEGEAIRTGLTLGPNNLGVMNRKRLRSIHLGKRNSSTVVKVTIDRESKNFSVTNGKAKITRDLMGEDVTLEIADFEELSIIEVTPVVLGLRG